MSLSLKLNRFTQPVFDRLYWVIARIGTLCATTTTIQDFGTVLDEIEPYLYFIHCRFDWERIRNGFRDYKRFRADPIEFVMSVAHRDEDWWSFDARMREITFLRIYTDYQERKPRWLLQQMNELTKQIEEEIEARRFALDLRAAISFCTPKKPLRLNRTPGRTSFFTLLDFKFLYRRDDGLFARSGPWKNQTYTRRNFIGFLSDLLHYECIHEVRWPKNRSWADIVKHTCRSRDLKILLDRYLVTALEMYCLGGVREYEHALRVRRAEIFLTYWNLPADLSAHVCIFIA